MINSCNLANWLSVKPISYIFYICIKKNIFQNILTDDVRQDLTNQMSNNEGQQYYLAAEQCALFCAKKKKKDYRAIRFHSYNIIRLVYCV